MFHTLRKVRKARNRLTAGGVRKRKKMRGTLTSTKRDQAAIACDDVDFLSKHQLRNRMKNNSVNVSGKRRRKIMKLMSRQSLPSRHTTLPEPMMTTQIKVKKQSISKAKKDPKKTKKKKSKKIEAVDLSTPEDSAEEMDDDNEDDDNDDGVNAEEMSEDDE